MVQKSKAMYNRGHGKYHISSNKYPQRLFHFEVLRCDADWKVALKRWRRLF